MPRKELKVLFFMTTTGDIDAVLNNDNANRAGTTLGTWSKGLRSGSFMIDEDGRVPTVSGSNGEIAGDLSAWINLMQSFRPKPRITPYSRYRYGDDEVVNDLSDNEN